MTSFRTQSVPLTQNVPRVMPLPENATAPSEIVRPTPQHAPELTNGSENASGVSGPPSQALEELERNRVESVDNLFSNRNAPRKRPPPPRPSYPNMQNESSMKQQHSFHLSSSKTSFFNTVKKRTRSYSKLVQDHKHPHKLLENTIEYEMHLLPWHAYAIITGKMKYHHDVT